MGLGYAVTRILDACPGLSPGAVEKRLAYGSFAHLRDRVVYLEVPKAACTAMKMVLRDLYASTPLTLYPQMSRQTKRGMFVHARVNAPLPALTELDDVAQRELLEDNDVLRFTVVRNPYTRFVSAWRDKVYLYEPTAEDVYVAVRGVAPDVGHKQPIQFPEFVTHVERTIGATTDPHWRRQVDLTYPDAIRYSHIGKTENLPATIEMLYRRAGHEPPETMPRANGAALLAGAAYTPTLAERVHGIYAQDFLAFDYDPEAWPCDSDAQTAVSLDRFVDEIIERNVIITHLYDERARLAREYDDVYRFSLTRLKNTWRRMFDPHPHPRA